MAQQLVYVKNKVDNSKIRRTTNERGDEIIIVPSMTLPDDVVMNRLLYPADEIAKGYASLEGTLAPIGHPYNDKGEYISATEAEAIDYFYAGVVNKNVQRVKDAKYGNRVYLEKWVNVAVAERTEHGKRLLKAIEKGEEIHSSTGVLVDIDYTKNRDEYDGVATGLIFDHDAILLDEEGAATPADGVGLFVNSHLFKQVSRNGLSMQVNTVTIKANQSMRDKEDKVRAAISALMPEKEWKWLADWGDDYAVMEVDGANYRVSYAYVDEQVEIMGEPEPVRRVTTWEAITNAAKKLFNRGKSAVTTNQEGDDMSMKTLMKERLGDAYKDDMTDEEMLNAYAKTLKGNAADTKNESKGEQAKPAGELEVNADIASLIQAEVAKALKANAAEAEKAERETLTAEITANSKDFTAEELAETSISLLRKMAANCKTKRHSFGVAGGQLATNKEQNVILDELPE